MLAEERRQEIVKLIDKLDTVHVKKISNKFNVTEETIRRDLAILEKKHLLKRIHGGAVSIYNSQEELSFDIRKEENVSAKKEIAAKAAKLIHTGDTIFLDASSTSMFLAKKLNQSHNITVITNSIRIVYELADNNNVNLISTGGILNLSTFSLVGPLANGSISKYYADKLFASCKGLDLKHGATDSYDLEIEVKKTMTKQARKVIIMADSSKFNQIGLTQFASLDQIEMIISDSTIKNSTKDLFLEQGLVFL